MLSVDDSRKFLRCRDRKGQAPILTVFNRPDAGVRDWRSACFFFDVFKLTLIKTCAQVIVGGNDDRIRKGRVHAVDVVRDIPKPLILNDALRSLQPVAATNFIHVRAHPVARCDLEEKFGGKDGQIESPEALFYPQGLGHKREGNRHQSLNPAVLPFNLRPVSPPDGASIGAFL